MANVAIPGSSLLFPQPPSAQPYAGVSTALTIDATGEKIAFIGTFYSPDRATKTINNVGFPTGAVVSAGGSTIRVSLQDVSTTSGPPGQPDGTQDQYRDALLSTYNSNSWFMSGLVTSDGTDTGSKRSVAHGELVGVVIEFDSGGRLGSDSLIVSSGTHQVSNVHRGAQAVLYTASWAIQNVVPSLIFECSDGTFATLCSAFPFKTRTGITYHSGSSPDEYGLKLVSPFAANGGVVENGGGYPLFVVPAGNALCLTSSAATAHGGRVTYVRTAAP